MCDCNKLSQDAAIKKIKDKCAEKGFEFVGFSNSDNVYTGYEVKLKLRCLKCNYYNENISYHRFVGKTEKVHTCPSEFKERGKKTTEAFTDKAISIIIEYLKNTDFEFISFKNNEFIGAKLTKVIIKCKHCGMVKEVTYHTIRNKSLSGRCTKCNHIKTSKIKYSLESIQKKANELNLSIVSISTNGNLGPKTKITLKCNECNTLLKDVPLQKFFIRGRSCPNCRIYNRISEKEVLTSIEKLCKERNWSFYGFVGGKYKNTSTKPIFKCNECDKTFIPSKVEDVLNIRNTIHVCESKIHERYIKLSGENNKKIEQLIKEKLSNTNFELVSMNINKETNMCTTVLVRCSKCNKIMNISPRTILEKSRFYCKNCERVWTMEMEMEDLLNENKINFIHDCRSGHLPWLKYKSSLSLDFYIPEYNIGIECQGEQHFKPIKHFGDNNFNLLRNRDVEKLKLCKEHGVMLLYYDSQNKNKEFLGERVYNTQEEMLDAIKKIINI